MWKPGALEAQAPGFVFYVGKNEMTLILDSASVDDARLATDMGFVTAITTNPVLLAKALAEDRRLKSREDVVAALCEVFPGTVMVQLMADSAEEREAEGRRLVGLRPGRIGLKIPAVPDNFPLARRFAAEGCTVGMTTIFSAGQAYLACEAGATIIFPYVNRSTRWLGDRAGAGAADAGRGGWAEIAHANHRGQHQDARGSGGHPSGRGAWTHRAPGDHPGIGPPFAL